MSQKRDRELEVISLFLGNYSKRLYVREISRLLKMPPQTAQRILENLKKGRVLNAEVRGKNKYFYLNLENIGTKGRLLQAEVYRTNMFLEKYIGFRLFMKEIQIPNPIILFGSFARFAADKNSDVDILILAGKDIELPYHLLPNKVHKIRMSERAFLKASISKETLIKKIEEEHIVINNHSFFINFMWDKYAK